MRPPSRVKAICYSQADIVVGEACVGVATFLEDVDVAAGATRNVVVATPWLAMGGRLSREGQGQREERDKGGAEAHCCNIIRGLRA